MVRRGIVLGVLFVATGVAPALAQSRVEVSGFYGWAFTDGVSGNSIIAGDGNVYDRVDPKDGQVYGFSVGVLATGNAEVGFIYSRQMSTLLLGGTNDRELGDLDITTYHGYFGYNFGETQVRPFVFIGFGATNFSDVPVTITGVRRTIPGETQFSTTWGGGVKVFVARHVGIRVAGQWTPTYIKTDSAGWWCDPYWGCYLVGNAQYANQFHLDGGVVVRF